MGARTEKDIDDVGLTLLLCLDMYGEDTDRDDLYTMFRIANEQHFSTWVAAPGWSWEEGLALFALLKVAEALPHLEKEPSVAAERALEALEAVCYADLLKALRETRDKQEGESERLVQTQLVSQYKKMAKKAANARHDQTTRPIKAKAIEVYESRSWPSALQAAKFIYGELKRFIEEKKIDFRFSDERAEKTIYGWILDHRKKTKAESL